MKLYYIYHSGFAIETMNSMLIIDYYKDANISSSPKKLVEDVLLNTNKNIYVLSTHIHHDHFAPHIFEWRKNNPTIKYILSSDILESKECCKKNEAIFIGRGESYKDDNLCIEAYGSTDAGISFAITIDGRRIFHAGDLNNWHWKDESSKEYSQEAQEFYLRELAFLKEHHREFDLVMFPVDQRLQTDYYLGAQQFVENIKVHYFAPMHFGEHYTEANDFEKIASKNGATFLKINHPGEEFEIKF